MDPVRRYAFHLNGHVNERLRDTVVARVQFVKGLTLWVISPPGHGLRVVLNGRMHGVSPPVTRQTWFGGIWVRFQVLTGGLDDADIKPAETMILQATVARKPGHRGEHAISR
jgi:hypothetical protein